MCTVCLNSTGDRDGATVRLNRYRATRWAVCRGATARGKSDILGRFENNLAVLAAHRGICVDNARLADQSAVNADLAGDDLADVDRLIVRGSDGDPQIRRTRIDNINALAGRENDFAALAGDCTAVLDVRRHQVNKAAAGGRNLTVIGHIACACTIGETHFSSEKIAVGQFEC